MRRSVLWALEESASRADAPNAREIETAIVRLRAERPAPSEDKQLATSATKDKGLAAVDRERVKHRALSSRAPSALDLARYLDVGTLTGLRPCEWPSAEFRKSSRQAFQWELVVANAKATNGRAHGEFRTLYWAHLPRHIVDEVVAWSEIARRPDYDTLLGTIRSLMARVTRELWPRRTKWPTLYSVRHGAVARWKSYYYRDGQTDEERRTALATIAALMGHGSDATATRHYARAAADEESRDFPPPAADPAEIARVRKVLDLRWQETLSVMKQKMKP